MYHSVAQLHYNSDMDMTWTQSGMLARMDATGLWWSDES